MMDFDTLNARGLFDARLPRYTSYPPAPAFAPEGGAELQARALAALDPANPISLYIHIPFCERLCWFCACRTQGVRSLGPVDSYIDTLLQELRIVARYIPAPLRLGHMHWGGGTPTILPPNLIGKLVDAIDNVFNRHADTEFSVEIDPTLVDAGKIAALQAAGMTRASIGIQDFSDKVQDSIGRHQSFERTLACTDMLRAAGIRSLNVDLVYGLPFQSIEGFGRTLDQVSHLWPDRVALFGYAHVPHMAKRQTMIPERALPCDRERFALSRHASQRLAAAGMVPIGIDHFARPRDAMAIAAADGSLRRNFQGYTADGCETLIGLGASSISRFGQGYVQNTPQTGRYNKIVKTGSLAGARCHHLTDDDKLRGRIIEMLMCDFAIDLDNLPPLSPAVRAAMDTTMRNYTDVLTRQGNRITLAEGAEALVRKIAHGFDAYADVESSYSRVS